MKTLFIILLLILLFNWFMRRIVPILFTSYFKNMSKQQGSWQPRTNKHKEGEVNIKQTAKPEKKIDKELGEYVTYTEINENK